MCPKGADGMANTVDPDQTAPAPLVEVVLCQKKLMKLSMKRGFYFSTAIRPLLGAEKQSNQMKNYTQA